MRVPSLEKGVLDFLQHLFIARVLARDRAQRFPRTLLQMVDVTDFLRSVECDALFRFLCDIVPGIMPITNSTQLLRFSDSCGAEVPRWIRLRLQAFGDDAAAIKDFGADVVAALCERLRQGGAPSLHFYTLNQSVGTLELCRRMGR